MQLIKIIQNDSIQALRSKDTFKLTTLRFIVSQLKYKEIELRREPTDEETVTIIRKQVKELSEACEQFKAGGRQDLFDENTKQIAIMKAYLPQEMSDEELSALISNYIAENKALYDSNPRAFTGKLVSVLRSKASPDRIVSLYNRASH